MKRIFALIIAIIAILVFTYSVCAEELTTDAPDINEEITVSAEDEKGIIDTIMNSTVWGSIASFVVMAGGIVIFVWKKFGTVIAMLKGNKADTSTVLNSVKGAIDDTFAEIQKKLTETQTKLDETEENNKKLTAILCMYIANDTKYNPTAKAEIMKYTSGIKKFAGTVEEICADAHKAISEAQANEPKQETPALDAIINEANEQEIMSLI